MIRRSTIITVIFILFVLVVSGLLCQHYFVNDPETNNSEEAVWKTAMMEYKCSDSQFNKVFVETDFCKERTRFTGRYCFSAAIIRNCDKLLK